MRSPRALAFSAALVGVAVLGVLVVASFVTPSEAADPRGGRERLGDIEDYPPDSVVPWQSEDGTQRAWVVRLSAGELIVFNARSTGRGCTVFWREQLNEPGAERGFKDVCQLSVWRQDGTLVFGNARRDLDRYPHEVESDGDVIVDFSRVIRGAERPNAPTTRTGVRP